MITLDVDFAELEHFARQVDASRSVMAAAARAAARSTARWARVQVARGLASRLGVPQAVANPRSRSRNNKAGAKVTILLNQLNVGGIASKVPSGLRAGRESFPGAFLAAGRYSGKTVALRRKGPPRKPLESAALDVLSVGGPLVEQTWPAVNARFVAEYRRELERRA